MTRDAPGYARAVKAARNIAIIAIIALGVWALPGGGTAASLFGAVLFVGLTLILGLLAGRLYLEHRTSLYALGDRYRGLLYGALGLAVLTLAAGPKLFNTGLGTVAWLALMGAASYALYLVFRRSREY